MTNFFSFFKLGNHGNNKSRNGAKRNDGKAPRKRRLALESLENRELLSVSTTDFDAIKSQYADLNLTNYADYNFIEIQANNLTDAALRNAITEATGTAKSDIIVLRTTDEHNKIMLSNGALTIDIDAETYGSIAIVSLGTQKLTIDANQQSEALIVNRYSEQNSGVPGATLIETDIALGGLIITGGKSERYGLGNITGYGQGGIYQYGGNLSITQCIITQNQSAQSGGGISFNGGQFGGMLQMTYSEIRENKTDGESNTGGGINVYKCETIISHCTISENSASRAGGGIFQYGSGSLTITDSIISGNRTAGGNWMMPTGGGGIYVETTFNGTSYDPLSVVIRNSDISNNSATTLGGGISVTNGSEGSLSITNSTIKDNSAKRGGGIDNCDGNLIIDNSIITGNKANEGEGGGIRQYIGSASISNSTISDNSAGGSTGTGGGLYFEMCRKESFITNCIIENNSTSGSGGGIFDDGGIGDTTKGLILLECTIQNNKANDAGGVFARGELTATNSIIRNNTAAKDGGGIVLSDMAIISGCNINENKANGNGGGIRASGSNITITHSSFTNNDAVGGGGLSVDGVVHVINSVFFNNTATFGGGVRLGPMDHTLTMTNCTIAYNNADGDSKNPLGGGGILHEVGGTIIGTSNPRYFESRLILNNCIVAENSNDICKGTGNVTVPVGYKWESHYYLAEIEGSNNLIGDGFRDNDYFLENSKDGNIVGTLTDKIDPKFGDATTTVGGLLYLPLLSGSRAINAGKSNSITTDIAGKPRVVHGTIDIGAYEYDGPFVANPPTTPANFTCTAQTTDSVTLTWTAQSNLTGYLLQYKKSTDTNWTTATAPATTANSATITGLDTNTAYNFQLTATNADGTATSTANATTKESGVVTNPPTAPANFTSTVQTTDSVTLTWTAQSDLTGYKLQYKKSTDTNWTTATAPATSATSATITVLAVATSYEFRLTAIKGDDFASSTTTATTATTTIQEAIPNVKPAKASGIKKEISLSTVKLTWKQNPAKNTHYVVKCTSFAGAIIGEITVVNNRHSVTITGLQPGVKYTFEIVSFNGSEAAKPTKVSVKTKTYAAVSKVTKTISGTTVNWTWADHKLKFPETTHYELLDATGTTVVETVTTNAVSKDLPPGTHKFSIRAVVKDAEENILFASKLKKISVKIK